LILIIGVVATLTLQRLEIPRRPFSQDFRSAVAVSLLLILLSQASILRLETGIKAAITTTNQPELTRIGGRPMFGYHDATGSLTQAGVTSEIGSHFIPWGERYQDQIVRALRSDREAGRQSLVTLEPWPWALLDSEDWDEPLHQRLSESLLKDIAAGQHDDALMASLRSLAADTTRVVYVRLMHEMEIKDQYPWWSRNPDEYTNAYRHIVHLARSQGMINLRWIWSPAGFRHASSYWPGNDVVDYVGLSIYATPEWNGGLIGPGANLSLDQLLKARYWVRRYEKPIILAEVGINDTDLGRRRWFAQALHDLPYFTDVVAWVYFNQPQPEIVKLDIPPPDWSLDSSEALDLRNLIERHAQ
jgi:endoglucanase